MNKFAIVQEFDRIVAAVHDARSWLECDDLEQTLAAIDDAAGMIHDIESAIYDAQTAEECDEPATDAPTQGPKHPAYGMLGPTPLSSRPLTASDFAKPAAGSKDPK